MSSPSSAAALNSDVYRHATQRRLWNNCFGTVAPVVGIWYVMAFISSDGRPDFPAGLGGWAVGLVLLWQMISGLGTGARRKWVEKGEA